MTTPLQHTSLGELGGYDPLLATSLGELDDGAAPPTPPEEGGGSGGPAAATREPHGAYIPPIVEIPREFELPSDYDDADLALLAVWLISEFYE